MIWLSTGTIARLRDQLKARGQRPSIVPPEPDLEAEAAGLTQAMTDYGPLCEAMYLMMSADGKVGAVEREVLRGALCNVAGDTVSTRHVDAMLDAAKKRALDEGRPARMKAIAAELAGDRARAEVAFVLAAALAYADNAIADQENDTLNELAEGLGIDEARANELLDDVERDLRAQKSG